MSTSEISKWDDLPIHQSIDFLGVAMNSDSHFNDGYYFSAYAPGIHVFMGLRLHPNNNVMDGYAGVVYEGKQRNTRVSRALLPLRDVFSVGNLHLEILEPMHRQRMWLESSEADFSFNLNFEAVGQPFVEARHRQIRYGRVINDVLRYTQPCRANGELTIDGNLISVDRWFGARDHSWGIRSTMGPHVQHGGLANTIEKDPRALRLWVPFEVGDHSGFFHLHEDEVGNVLDCEGRIDFTDGSSQNVVGVRHALRYQPTSGRLHSGKFVLLMQDSTQREYEFEVVCHPAHPQGFGYARGWSDLGQPGVYRGALVGESDQFRVDDAAQVHGPVHVRRAERMGGTEFACVMRGAGGSGMAHVEHMIYGAYKPYGFTKKNGAE